MCKKHKITRQKGMIFINYQSLQEEYINLVLNIELLSSQYGLTYTETVRQAKYKHMTNLIYINSGVWNELANDFNIVELHTKEYANKYGIGINKLRKRLAKTDINSIGTTLTSAIGLAIQKVA